MISGDGDEQLTRVRSAVHGYCAAHKDFVPQRFRDELDREGTIEWMPDPAELRPTEAQGFLAHVDQLSQQVSTALGGAPVPASVTAQLAAGELPTDCPHCQGRLSWGSGPHVQDAAKRPGSTAWECLDCQAAGMTVHT